MPDPNIPANPLIASIQGPPTTFLHLLGVEMSEGDLQPGNVTLRLYVDHAGQVTPDSTRIEESSGYAGLDSAAVKGSQDLRFAPARLRGEPLGVSILFPVYFRHPDAHALPGDTILQRMKHATPEER